MTRILPAFIASLFLSLPLAPVLGAESDVEELTRLLKLRLGTDAVEPATETGVEGVYQTRFGNKFAYLIEGGRYVFIGDMVDLKMARNLTEMSRRNLVVDELAAFDEEKLIIFPAVDDEKAVLNVFTDTSCGYCQLLHKEIGHLQAAGISVHYFPYPRGGQRGPGYQDMQKVWCAEDRREAMSIAKGATPGELVQDGELCAAAGYLDEGYALGNRIGVSGTPALFTSDGTSFAGYVPYQQLIPQILEP